jgi:hypothetical protein
LKGKGQGKVRKGLNDEPISCVLPLTVTTVPTGELQGTVVSVRQRTRPNGWDRVLPTSANNVSPETRVTYLERALQQTIDARIFEIQSHISTEDELKIVKQKLVDTEQKLSTLEEAIANSDPVSRVIHNFNKIVYPLIHWYLWFAVGILNEIVGIMFPTEDSLNPSEEKPYSYIGYLFADLRSRLPIWMNVLIATIDESNLKKYIVFWSISLCLSFWFLMVLLFVQCKGVVNKQTNDYEYMFIAVNITTFSHVEPVSIFRYGCFFYGELALFVLTTCICYFHNNTVKSGYVALIAWVIWIVAFIGEDFLALFLDHEMECPYMLHSTALNATQTDMLSGARVVIE